jgi:hypothetical protein
MAGSSSVTGTTLLSNPISEKLTKANHAIWKAQILVVPRGANLEGHLTGAKRMPLEKIKERENMVPNLAYQEWYVADQQVLAYLLLSLSREIMGQVAICTTAASAWGIIEGMYTLGTRARSVNTRIALATIKKGSDSIEIDDEELISYILTGLDVEYNSVVSALVARPDTITIGEVYSQLMSYEQRIEWQQHAENYQAPVNAASCGWGNVCGCMGPRRGRSPSRGRGRHPGHSSSHAGHSYG